MRFFITTKITGNLTEKEIHFAFKKFLRENFQNFELATAGKNETLRDSFNLKGGQNGKD